MNNSKTDSVRYKNNANFELLRVPFTKAKGTCPVCGRNRRARDWKCSVTEDGSLAICSYKPSDKTDSEGRYIHILRENDFTSRPEEIIKPKPNIIASAEKVDKIYREFLNSLILKPQHADNLLERELSDTSIAYNLYASTPSFDECKEVVRKLCEKLPNDDLSGVAGFYTDERKNWQMVFFSSGFFVPFKNVKGQIVGLQVRLDKPTDDAKYIWFSSSSKLNGTAQTMPLHFASPDLVRQTGKIILTEGALKADICADLLGCATAAIAGTGISEEKANEYAQILIKEFPELKTVQLAPDADWRENQNVRNAFLRLKAAMEKAGLKVEVLTWDAALGKGIDDFLKAEME